MLRCKVSTHKEEPQLKNVEKVYRPDYAHTATSFSHLGNDLDHRNYMQYRLLEGSKTPEPGEDKNRILNLEIRQQVSNQLIDSMKQ